jgi:hypothetical protein
VDAIEAHKWFYIASEGGDAAGHANLIRSESQLGSSQIAEARRRAKGWLQARSSKIEV